MGLSSFALTWRRPKTEMAKSVFVMIYLPLARILDLDQVGRPHVIGGDEEVGDVDLAYDGASVAARDNEAVRGFRVHDDSYLGARRRTRSRTLSSLFVWYSLAAGREDELSRVGPSRSSPGGRASSLHVRGGVLTD